MNKSTLAALAAAVTLLVASEARASWLGDRVGVAGKVIQKIPNPICSIGCLPVPVPAPHDVPNPTKLVLDAGKFVGDKIILGGKAVGTVVFNTSKGASGAVVDVGKTAVGAAKEAAVAPLLSVEAQVTGAVELAGKGTVDPTAYAKLAVAIEAGQVVALARRSGVVKTEAQCEALNAVVSDGLAATVLVKSGDPASATAVSVASRQGGSMACQDSFASSPAPGADAAGSADQVNSASSSPAESAPPVPVFSPVPADAQRQVAAMLQAIADMHQQTLGRIHDDAVAAAVASTKASAPASADAGAPAAPTDSPSVVTAAAAPAADGVERSSLPIASNTLPPAH